MTSSGASPAELSTGGPRFAAIASALDELGLRSLLLVGNDDNLDAVAHRDGAFVFAPLAPVLARCRAGALADAVDSVLTS